MLFQCKVVIYLPKEKQTKLDNGTRSGIKLGYRNNSMEPIVLHMKAANTISAPSTSFCKPIEYPGFLNNALKECVFTHKTLILTIEQRLVNLFGMMTLMTRLMLK